MLRVTTVLRAARTFAACAALISCGAKGELAYNPSNVVPDDAEPSDGGPDPLDGSPRPVSCSVTAPTSCPDPPPRYADVQPIFEQRCILCHNGTNDGPWALTDYEHIADWQEIIRADLLDCTMPPVDAGVPITRDERLAILVWIRCALPR
jgi:predicted small lipoprotein YifL